MGDFFCEPIIFRKRWCKTVDISARGKVYSIGDKGGDELSLNMLLSRGKDIQK